MKSADKENKIQILQYKINQTDLSTLRKYKNSNNADKDRWVQNLAKKYSVLRIRIRITWYRFALLERKLSVVGITRYYTKKFVILHEFVHAFLISVKYHELFRVVLSLGIPATFFSDPTKPLKTENIRT